MGDHLRRRRVELGLFQKTVAERLGIDEHTICNWEKGQTTPPIHFMPRIIEFLGYYPYGAPQTLGERLTAIRRTLGVSRARLAQMIGIDEGTVLRVERSTGCLSAHSEERVRESLATMPAIMGRCAD